ncbi:MAG: glutamine-hydrolyzing GMP synthase [Phycisphaerales bacterium]|nr:glutamine-hydrolyzing GMP synthase [Phycisphaerales bacterium]
MPTPAAHAETRQVPPRAASDEVVLVMDFGSQTAQLIARRIRDAGVLAYLISPDEPIDAIQARKPRAIVLSGGPASVYDKGAPECNPEVLKLGIPILGICYGMQAACVALGGSVERAGRREYGAAPLHRVPVMSDAGLLLDGIPEHATVWMSHGDQVANLDAHFDTLASTPTCPHAVVKHKKLPFYAVQFHPEVTHTPHGIDIFRNFLFSIANCRGSWSMADFLDRSIERIRKLVGNKRVLCGLSGGVDSSVAAALIHRAVGDQLTCVFVDNGLLRKSERRLVENTFRDHFDIDLRVADASEHFLEDLAGITDPQEKRRRIGHRFIEVFKREAQALEQSHGKFDFLAQGTLYPDVIESGHGHAGLSAGIKLHHNVGGLPEELGFELLEPLRDLFKDEARKLGEVLGLPEQIVWRHPFPGPGLAVRVLGEVTSEALDILRDCDEILLEEITAAGQYRTTAQVFAVLLPIRSVGVMGDGRSYDRVVAIRAVTSEDFMTADWARLPHDLLARISSRIINDVEGVNRVVYDISTKPPSTIEWE